VAGVIESKDTRGTGNMTFRILLKKVLSYIDESAWAAIFGEFGDEGFGLLDEALEGCRRGFAKGDWRELVPRIFMYGGRQQGSRNRRAS
jgi:hypothetical protein